MAENSAIEWCDHTFNPWRGCTKVSDGCKFCYADTLSKRNPKALGVWGPQGTRVMASESYWQQPLRWNRDAKATEIRRRVFCASLADVFEGPETCSAEAYAVIQAARERLFAIARDTQWLDWLFLTKRPENIPTILAQHRHPREPHEDWWTLAQRQPRPNWWFGTSVEDQKSADERLYHLMKVPAVVRFISCEPLLGPVDLRHVQYDRIVEFDVLTGDHGVTRPLAGRDPGRRVHWVIAGGESGPNARPMHPKWAQSLRDQCADAGTPFLFKQWGEFGSQSQNLSTGDVTFREFLNVQQWFNKGREWVSGGICLDATGRRLETGADFHNATYPVTVMHRVGKHNAGRLLDGVQHDGYPSEPGGAGEP